MDDDMRFSTGCIHGPKPFREINTRDVIPPIHMSSTYFFENAEQGGKLFTGEEEGFIYTRLSNPTVKILEERMAFLEKGECACAFSSGMAAISGVILYFLKPNEKVIYSEPIYGGTFALFKLLNEKLGIEFIGIKAKDFLNELKDKIEKYKPKLVYLETPANPTLDIFDIEETSKICKRENIPLVIDNTFATPYHQRPIEKGADVVIHSLTKYLTGHSDAIGGIVISRKEIVQPIKEHYLTHLGGCLSPFNAWLTLRGIKTLHLRMERHSTNAMKLAEFLNNHPNVERVFYPGLKNFEGHKIAKKQMENGFSGMLSFIIKGGKEKGIKFLNSLRICTLAVSLGAVETLVEHPASMTHSTYTEDELLKAGIDPGLIRVSVGLEDIDDIIEDFERALR
ncbi:MAG: aminotransferase class I/II-fold pyridoxal phosphate-dependent enzyme [candidate division WOR-3 bacterium]